MPPDPVVLPPAQPSYVLRGHQSQIHALSFYAGNRRLLSGDGDGFVISWDVATKRPVAGWRAHSRAILGVASWPLSSSSSPPRRRFYDADDGDGHIITHGRDGRIAVWRLDAATERLMHAYVPPDRLEEVTAKPAMLHELAVGSVGFCAFSICEAPFDMTFADLSLSSNGGGGDDDNLKSKVNHTSEWPRRAPLLLAAPSAKNSEDIDIFYLPSGTRKSTVAAPKTGDPKLGMAMDVIVSVPPSGVLTLAVGHESGDLIVHQHSTATDSWKVRYRARAHAQPILSLCLHPLQRVCFSSGADGVLARHPFADPDLLESATAGKEGGEGTPLRVVQTKHSGQQGLTMRSDGRVFASAGWDARVRVYSAKTMREVAVLKGHRQGCYATALAEVLEDRNGNGKSEVDDDKVKKESGGIDRRENINVRLDKVNKKYRLGLQAEGFLTPPSSQDEDSMLQAMMEKVINLKKKHPEKLHRVLDEYEAWTSKQQDMYSDHKEAAEELGLLQADPPYARFLLDLLDESTIQTKSEGLDKDESGAKILVPATPEKSRAMTRYEIKVRSTHWLAAGSKDGTISLWDVF